MKQINTNTKHKQAGQGMVEYIIIVALIAIAAIGAYSKFGETVRHQVAGLSAELAGNDGAAEIGAAKASAGAAGELAKEKIGLGNYDAAGSKGVLK